MLIGKEFGPYVIEKELGSGAMGTVYLAKHKKSGQKVAIKLMSMALGTSENAIKRFSREIEILKQLDHVNIVKYINSGRYHNSRFIMMEYVEGESLDHILHRRGRLPWAEVLPLGMNLCAALQHAHDKGIIHRDLKPSNLMILKDGVAKLTDFGIAKDTDVTALTAANSTVGTAAYMSPEQCRGVRDITHKTDLYSMGIMFYELLTGKKPFVGESAMEVFLQHANKTTYKRPSEIILDVPIWVDKLVDQLMEKEPAKRPLNANAVADSLQLIKDKLDAQRGGEPATKRKGERNGKKGAVEEKPIPPPKKKPKPVQPFYTKGWFTILALALVMAAIGVFVYVAFLMTPGAESLYNQAEALKMDDKKAAREGPIADFLRLYPRHENAGRVQMWADEIDLEMLDKQMHNRRNSPLKFTTTPEEDLFRAALKDEEEGDLKTASTRWEQLIRKKNTPGPDMRAWGLIGERYAEDVRAVEDLYLHLKGLVESKEKARFELEALGLEAVRAENSAVKTETIKKWEAVKRAAAEVRQWRLLADKRLAELK